MAGKDLAVNNQKSRPNFEAKATEFLAGKEDCMKEKVVEHPLRLAYYNQTHLESLISSIKMSGLLEPILVQPLEDG